MNTAQRNAVDARMIARRVIAAVRASAPAGEPDGWVSADFIRASVAGYPRPSGRLTRNPDWWVGPLRVAGVYSEMQNLGERRNVRGRLLSDLHQIA